MRAMVAPHHRQALSPLQPLLLFLALLLITAARAESATAATGLVNVRVVQQIRPAGAVAHHDVALRMRNDGTTPARAVELLVRREDADAGALALLLAADAAPTASWSSSRSAARLRVVPREHGADGVPDDFRGFRVDLREPLAPGAEKDLFLSMQFTHAIKPVPAEIAERETQYFRYSGSAVFMSPYKTESMETSIKLPSADLTSYPEQPVPVTVNGDTVKLGPYKDVPPLAHQPIGVRFRDNAGVLVADHAVRQMHISHWGNVAVKEEFHIENAGAKYVGRWSRVDFAERRDETCPTAIGDIWANLPSAATNVLYKDLVGNITTSRLRNPSKKHRALQLHFRFPLLGGWRNHFWYTYDVPLHDFSASKGSSHVVAIPVFPSVNERYLCRRLTVRVLLPEGASNVRVMPHQTIPFVIRHSVEKTSLNYFGRTVVTLIADNFFTSRKLHASTVKISYDFPVVNLLLTPMIIAVGIFAVFLAYITYANTEVLLVSTKDDPAATRVLGITEQQNRIAATCAKMEASYALLDFLFDNMSKAISDEQKAADMERQRMELESALKESESDLALAATELKQLGSGKADLASTLLRRFSSKRDCWMRAISLRRMSENRSNDHAKYEKTMNDTIKPALVEIAVDIDDLLIALTEDL